MPDPSRHQTLINRLIVNELRMADQYRLHARLYQKWGLRSLAAQFKDESAVKLEQAQQIIDRQNPGAEDIQLDPISRMPMGSTIKTCLEFDLQMEKSVAEVYRQLLDLDAGEFADECRRLLTTGLEDSKDQVDFLSLQLEQIDRTGIRGYLQNELNFFNYWRMSSA